MRGVTEAGLDVVKIDAPEASRSEVLANHEPGYFDMIEELCARGGGRLDYDTRVGPHSWEAALRSAGAAGAAIDALTAGDADVAFVATRPPGHHALASRAMGFCLFNNIAIGARRLTAQGRRVAIVDWDVHHGNGTQDSFYEDPSVLYVSLHQSGFYPGTGSMQERGAGQGGGTTVNLPLPPRTGGDVYRWLFHTVVRRELDRFRPDWLLVSAGYDAHHSDPLADLALVDDDYEAMAAALAASVPPRRTVFLLEGGYDLDALRGAAAATLRGSVGGPPPTPPPPPPDAPGASAARRLATFFGGEEVQGA